MRATDAILMRWRHEDPDRLLQAALRQARELAELGPELDALRSQNVTLRQQLELQTKRIAVPSCKKCSKGPSVLPTGRLLLSGLKKKSAS